MQLMLGWSSEQPNGDWRKVNLTLDETDLQRLFTEADMSPDLVKDISATTAFSLLEVECQRLILAELIQRFPESFDSPEHRQELKTLYTSRSSILQRIGLSV